MRFLTLLSFFLLSLFCGTGEAVGRVREHRSACILSASAAPETPFEGVLNRDLCLTAVPGQVLAGGGTGHAGSLRPGQGGRRISPQTRAPFRIVKGGKVIGNHRTHPFLARASAPESGMSVPERYLFSICRLRL